MKFTLYESIFKYEYNDPKLVRYNLFFYLVYYSNITKFESLVACRPHMWKYLVGSGNQHVFFDSMVTNMLIEREVGAFWSLDDNTLA